jgi:hypothetical protein
VEINNVKLAPNSAEKRNQRVYIGANLGEAAINDGLDRVRKDYAAKGKVNADTKFQVVTEEV